MTELRALTGARGIAAWAVVLYHLRLSLGWLPEGAVAALGKGYLAVDFFFLLSGFVMALAWDNRFRAAGWRATLPFWGKRVARVWPLHAAMLGYALALALALRATGRSDPHFPLADWLLHLLLLQDWGLADPLTWNDPAWSISAEASAYLLFPLLALGLDWRRVPTPAVLAAIAALAVMLASAFAAAGAASLGHDIGRFGVLRCLAEFAAGTAVHALWDRRRTGVALPLAMGALLLAAHGTGALPESLAVPPAFAALLLALARSAGRTGHPLEGRAVHRLGEVSYATYLAHYLLWITVKLALVRDANHVPPAVAVLYLALVLLASVVLHEALEKPARALLARAAPFSRRSRTRPPAPSAAPR